MTTFPQEGCSSREKENFLKEIIVMAQFMHPNIVRVFGSVDEGKCVCIHLVLCANYFLGKEKKAYAIKLCSFNCSWKICLCNLSL